MYSMLTKPSLRRISLQFSTFMKKTEVKLIFSYMIMLCICLQSSLRQVQRTGIESYFVGHFINQQKKKTSVSKSIREIKISVSVYKQEVVKLIMPVQSQSLITSGCNLYTFTMLHSFKLTNSINHKNVNSFSIRPG